MKKEEIESIIKELFKDWNNLSPIEFFNKNAPERMEDLNIQIRELLNNELFVIKGENYLMLSGKRKINYSGHEIVPLEKVPDVYREIYGREMI